MSIIFLCLHLLVSVSQSSLSLPLVLPALLHSYPSLTLSITHFFLHLSFLSLHSTIPIFSSPVSFFLHPLSLSPFISFFNFISHLLLTSSLPLAFLSNFQPFFHFQSSSPLFPYFLSVYPSFLSLFNFINHPLPFFSYFFLNFLSFHPLIP